jgi:uncharacterized alkaline shock family protein YloU
MSSDHVITSELGSVTIVRAALAQVVVRSAEQVEGIRVRRPRRGLEIALDDDRARVSVELAARYGVVLPDAARDVQARVAEALRTQIGLHTTAVDVSLEELDGP